MADERDFITTVRRRLSMALDADREERDKALDDLRFLDGEQWPEETKNSRVGRPCLTINKLPSHVDQVVGEQRKNRPSIRVRPVDSKSDPELAEIFSGLIRNIEGVSNADQAYDHAFEHGVASGRGAWRVLTRFCDDDIFEQDIVIAPIQNALSVVWDPASSMYDRSDAGYCFLITDIDKEEFKEEYGEEFMDFTDADGPHTDSWITEGKVRVAEYFEKRKVKKTLHLLIDGRVIWDENLKELVAGKEDADRQKYAIQRSREVEATEVTWYLLDGRKVLEKKKWAGKYIPVVEFSGKELNVGGKRKRRGLVRNAKDPQRMYNYTRSSITETVAQAPRHPYLVTPKMIAGHEGRWNTAHQQNYPYLPYNVDPSAPAGKPYREQPATVPAGMVNELNIADQEIRDTTGLQKASLGMQSNEKSGIAIRERKLEGDTGQFAYIDNLARSIQHTGRILLDLIPKIYDTERVVRLIGVDGKEQFETVNQKILDRNGNEVILNDLSAGKYDVAVTVGPSFTTQRVEAAASQMDFLGAVPTAAPIIMDLIAANMDWPEADKISERLRKVLPPGIAEDAQGAGEQNGGPPPPATGAAAPAPPPPPPDPLMEIRVAQEQEKLKGLQLDNMLKQVQIESSKDKIKQMVNEIMAGGQV
jgi:hypothetical protein